MSDTPNWEAMQKDLRGIRGAMIMPGDNIGEPLLGQVWQRAATEFVEDNDLLPELWSPFFSAIVHLYLSNPAATLGLLVEGIKHPKEYTAFLESLSRACEEINVGVPSPLGMEVQTLAPLHGFIAALLNQPDILGDQGTFPEAYEEIQFR